MYYREVMVVGSWEDEKMIEQSGTCRVGSAVGITRDRPPRLQLRRGKKDGSGIGCLFVVPG